MDAGSRRRRFAGSPVAGSHGSAGTSPAAGKGNGPRETGGHETAPWLDAERRFVRWSHDARDSLCAAFQEQGAEKAAVDLLGNLPQEESGRETEAGNDFGLVRLKLSLVLEYF